MKKIFLVFLFKAATVLLFLVLTLFSCTNKNKSEKISQKQISLSPPVELLMKDTVSYSPVVDSLKRQYVSAVDTDQILLLSELAEHWRPHSNKFANEALDQSKKTNFAYGEAMAYCKLGIFYYRAHLNDSANFYLDKAYDLSVSKHWDKITAQSLSWKGEALRWSGEKEKALELLDKALNIALKINDKQRAAFCLMSKGEAFRFMGEMEEAFDCYHKCINYSKEVGDISKIIFCNNSMADIYRVQGDYVKSLEHFQNAMELAKQNGNKSQLAYSLNNIGEIYSAQKEFNKSLTYYKDALKIATEIQDKLRVTNLYNSMGATYQQLQNVDMAFECFDRSLKIAEEIGNYDNAALALQKIGSLYFIQKNISKAIEFYDRALEIAKETGNLGQQSDIFFGLGECYFNIHEMEKAKSMVTKSLVLSQQNNLLPQIKDGAFFLYKINQLQNNSAEALKNLAIYITMKDSIGNEEQVRQFAAVEYQAKEAGLKAEQIAKEQTFKAEQGRKEEELKRQKTIRYAFTIGFGLMLILALVIYRGLRLNKRQTKIISTQKKEMEHQKELVEEKNKEIIDSITYAKRLQEAILPPLKLVKQFFPESFILYKPKDIIAGDFYWMEHIEDLTFYAAADSTGHGVPGAMVSVVCSNALNRAVKEFRLKDPGKILDKTRELVIETFEKSEGEVKDGMDISLIIVNHKAKQISWSGANNPLWYSNDGQLIEIKAHKQTIGKTDNPLPFVTHQIEYKKDNIFYLLTDGFADQFGGPKGKKFKYKQLEEIILSNSNKPLDEQYIILEKTFEEWRGIFDQVDDVTILGIKI